MAQIMLIDNKEKIISQMKCIYLHSAFMKSYMVL